MQACQPFAAASLATSEASASAPTGGLDLAAQPYIFGVSHTWAASQHDYGLRIQVCIINCPMHHTRTLQRLLHAMAVAMPAYVGVVLVPEPVQAVYELRASALDLCMRLGERYFRVGAESDPGARCWTCAVSN